MSQREEIIARAKALPQLPASVNEALAVLQDPNANMEALAKVIEYDPGLTATLLRLANSSYFAAVSTISSVREAVVRMGANRVFQLLMASAVTPYVKPAVLGYGLEKGVLLDHCIAVAISSELVAKELKIAPPPHTFTSGLLINIGKIVLGEYLEIDPTPIITLAHEELISFEEAEKQVLGINHVELGSLLLEHWQLPQEIVEVVRWHHNPEFFEQQNLTLDLVHVGDTVAKMVGIGIGYDGLHYHPSPVVFARLHLTPRTMETVMAALLEEMEGLREVLNPR